MQGEFRVFEWDSGLIGGAVKALWGLVNVVQDGCLVMLAEGEEVMVDVKLADAK